MSYNSKQVVLGIEEWNVTANKYMAPKINDKGMKSITVISRQTNRSLHISTPLMMTWGVSDFVDEKGESDGKFSISLNFPNEEFKNSSTDLFLQKLKDFESQIIDDAVKNSEVWWGEEIPREVTKHNFFPLLKYSKNRDTKKIDYTKPPAIRAKVPFYDGKWGIEIYNTDSEKIFPCENVHLTPVDFIPKFSSVACVLNCNGIWIGGKGWGLSWKLIQCVVKPRVIQSVYGTCHIKLSDEERNIINTQVIHDDEDDSHTTQSQQVVSKPAPVSTIVEDSDDEDTSVPQPPPVTEITKKVTKKSLVETNDNPLQFTEQPIVSDPEQVVTETPSTPVPVKKVIKKRT
jgi:hypothetical protein